MEEFESSVKLYLGEGKYAEIIDVFEKEDGKFRNFYRELFKFNSYLIDVKSENGTFEITFGNQKNIARTILDDQVDWNCDKNMLLACVKNFKEILKAYEE